MANTTQILVRNPVGVLTNYGDIHKIQCITFSFDVYSETCETSDVMGIQFVVSVLRIWSKVGSSSLDLPTSPPLTAASGATWSPRCTALSLPPSTSCRPISPGRWLSLTQRWWGGPCLTLGQGQLGASQQGVASLKSRPVITHFWSERFAVDSLYILCITHYYYYSH